MAAGLVGWRGEKALFQRVISSSQLRGQNDVLVFLTKREGSNSMAMSFCGRLVVSRFQKVLFGVGLSVTVLAHSSIARAEFAVGPLFRVVTCVSNCSGTLFTFGGELGGGITSFAFRYGYRNSGHYLFPDFRVSYTFSLPMSLEVTPLFEFTPMMKFSKQSGVSEKGIQLVLRPGVRVGWAPTSFVSIFVEPILWDFGVYTKVWVSGGLGSHSESPKELVSRYSFGFGALLRF